MLRQAWGIAAVLMLAVAGCSSSEATVDASRLERDIKTELERSNRVTRIDCPDEVRLERGATFECTATVEGQRQTIDVEITGDKRVDFTLRS